MAQKLKAAQKPESKPNNPIAKPEPGWPAKNGGKSGGGRKNNPPKK